MSAARLANPKSIITIAADALDVTRPELYDFMREFLSEMGGIFTEDYLVRSKLLAGADSVSLAGASDAQWLHLWPGTDCIHDALVVASSSAVTSFRSHVLPRAQPSPRG